MEKLRTLKLEALEARIAPTLVGLEEVGARIAATAGLDIEYRLYAPGATHWGQAR